MEIYTQILYNINYNDKNKKIWRNTMKVKVCVGSNCTLLGSMSILDQIDDLKDIISEDSDSYNDEELEVEVIKCLGYCKNTDVKVAPVVVIDDEPMYNATSQTVMEKIINKIRK
ncbi:MAG TPA: NADH-quinone oxidoreductase [Clostridiales bacterium]|nr:NADH-quinone oxidoreductase [Clostridiales bacterium]